MNTVAVIPAFDEAAAIGELVGELLAGAFAAAIVVDGGSRDGTDRIARARGARVVHEPRRGYGRAVMTGAGIARELGADVIVFVDGNGTVTAGEAARVAAPVTGGDAELAIGCRPGADLRSLQRLGNRLAVEVIARTQGVRYADIGSTRAITAAAMNALGLDEHGYGWPLQLQVRAAARGLRIAQVPIQLRARLGQSKVSGSLRGQLGASAAFLRVLASECVLQGSQ